MNDHAPIKRHESLVSFSRDHHFGLLLVWKIKQGLHQEVDPVRVSNYVLYFFQADILPHFEEEEKQLFPMLPEDNSLRLHAENDHQKLRMMLAGLEKNKSDVALLMELAKTLTFHIRFEERELFKYMQQTVSASQLENIHHHDESRGRDADANWDDEFWIVEKKK